MVDKIDRPRLLLVNRCLVKNDAGQILVVKRAETDPWQPGKWEFPGGKLDMGQDISHALEREVLEETGLYVNLVSRMMFIDSYVLPQDSKYAGLTYLMIVGKGKMIGGKLAPNKEIDQCKWVSKSEAFDMDLTDETRKALAALDRSD